jgi:hypothetical protein
MQPTISTHEANELAEHLLAELSNELTCLSVDDYSMIMELLLRQLGDKKKLAKWIREFYGEDAEYENELARKEMQAQRIASL